MPTTLYPRGTSNSAGSISHARHEAAGRPELAWLVTLSYSTLPVPCPLPCCDPLPPHQLYPQAPLASLPIPPHPVPPHILRELELLTLEESLLGEGASLLGLCRRELTGSSHPLRLPKVIRALRIWKMGISAGKGKKKRGGKLAVPARSAAEPSPYQS